MLLNPAIVIDDNNRLHVLFARSEGSDSESNERGMYSGDILYASNPQKQFGTPHDIATGSISPYVSIGIDSLGALHGAISREIGGDIPCINYLSTEQGEWETQGTGGCDGVEQTAQAMALSPDGEAHFVYEEAGTIYYIRKSAAGVWRTPINISGPSPADRTPAIAVAPDGTVHVLFYRWNSSDRRTLLYVKGNGSSFSAPRTLRVMPGSSTGLNRSFAAPPFVPSLTVDGDGTCHVIFPSVLGTDPTLGQLMYMQDKGGSWSEPTILAGLSFFNRVSIVADNRNELHLAAERFDNAGGDWDIIYMQTTNGIWSDPVDLTQNDVDDFAPSGGGAFLRAKGSGLALVYQSFEPNPKALEGKPGNEIVVLSKNLEPAPVLSVSPSELDFGEIGVDSVVVRQVVVRNSGAGQISYDVSPITVTGKPNLFAVSGVEPMKLESDGVDTLIVRFQPSDSGCFEEHLTVSTSSGTGSVILTGCALPKRLTITERPHGIRLDTVAGHVGDKITLTCSIDPAPNAADLLTEFEIELAFDRNALYPRSVIRAHGAELTPLPGGRLRVTRSGSTSVEGAELFRLELEGLVTGRPDNIVEIRSASLNGSSDLITTSDGLVRLEGCDIGRDVGFGRRVAISAVVPSPIVNDADIRWRAPEGIRSSLNLINAAGEVVESRLLPEGTGSEESLYLNTDNLPPGWYLLEIIDRAERHAIPVLIAE